ncbi:MAG: hypothetical protein LBN22_06260, partial [Clostridiales Family XIII bacterium]|nr:hypothetical protein [Clostridiales Family XIII bacterium]
YAYNFDQDIENESEALHIARDVCGIADFIVPAFYYQFFSKLIMIKSVIPVPFQSEDQYIHHKGNGVLSKGKYIPFLQSEKRANQDPMWRFYSYTEGSLSPLTLQEQVVLDIDLDYFCWDDTLSSAPPKRLEITKDAYTEYMLNPYHPFRLLPRQLLSVIQIEHQYFIEYKEHGIPDKPATEDRILSRIDKLCMWLQDNKIVPALIDICRSAHSGYTPADKVLFIEKHLIARLESIYPIQVGFGVDVGV